ncbi:unnamed protein product [Anisakis simplex]|uniref:Uncharacterized protein n=1 Tax=Anisakis simplex TaxID=6269 RepID=A0A0M3K7F1_ANISI|nr:unnamed protein product [Anisakis simplex]
MPSTLHPKFIIVTVSPILLLIISNINLICTNPIRHRFSIARRKLLQKVELKYVLQKCRVPIECHLKLFSELMQKESLSDCDGIEYGHLLTCIESSCTLKCLPEVSPRFSDLDEVMNKPMLKISATGDICCSPAESNTSRWCRSACASSMYAPTLSTRERLKRIEYFCNSGNAADQVNLLRT